MLHLMYRCVIQGIFHPSICSVCIDLDGLHSYIFIVHHKGKSTFSKMLLLSHMQKYLSVQVYTKNGSILLHKGIKIYAPNSHYHQIRRKAIWKLPPPYPFACMHVCQKQIVGKRKGWGMPGGIWTSWYGGEYKKNWKNFQISVQY